MSNCQFLHPPVPLLLHLPLAGAVLVHLRSLRHLHRLLPTHVGTGRRRRRLLHALLLLHVVLHRAVIVGLRHGRRRPRRLHRVLRRHVAGDAGGRLEAQLGHVQLAAVVQAVHRVGGGVRGVHPHGGDVGGRGGRVLDGRLHLLLLLLARVGVEFGVLVVVVRFGLVLWLVWARRDRFDVLGTGNGVCTVSSFLLYNHMIKAFVYLPTGFMQN